jgi:hypothetical protein
MDPIVRRGLRTKAVIGWALLTIVFVALSMPSGPPPSPEFFLLVLGMMVGISALVGLPLSYALVLVDHWFQSRWRQRWGSRLFPHSVPASAANPLPFRHSGRRWKTSAGTMAILLIILSLLLVVPTSGELVLDAFRTIVLWLSVPFAAFAIPASLLGLRRMTFEVDDLGVRVRRPFRSFDVRWDAIARLERCRALPRIPLLLPEEAGNLRIFALCGKESTIAGIVAPSAEVGGHQGEAFESALVGYALAHGLPVVDVSWRERRSWKQRRGSPTL